MVVQRYGRDIRVQINADLVVIKLISASAKSRLPSEIVHKVISKRLSSRYAWLKYRTFADYLLAFIFDLLKDGFVKQYHYYRDRQLLNGTPISINKSLKI